MNPNKETAAHARFSTAPVAKGGSSGRAAARRRALRSERGSTLVEFALVFILFMTMLLGIAGFGWALYAYHFASNAAREATRWAIVNGSTCDVDLSCNGTAPMNNGPATLADVQNYVKNITPPGINWSQVTVTACGVQGQAECANSVPTYCATTVNEPGCTVQVVVSYQFSFVFPLLPSAPLSLSSESEMVIAH